MRLQPRNHWTTTPLIATSPLPALFPLLDLPSTPVSLLYTARRHSSSPARNMVKHEKKTGEIAPISRWIALEDGYYERNNLQCEAQISVYRQFKVDD